MTDLDYIRLALRLAQRGYGMTSPNPMVGAVLVKGGKIIGRGWHHRAGCPHAEIEALLDAKKRRHHPRGATLYVTLEPCSTHGRTPPCTDAITAAGIKRMVVGGTDPNPKHAGKGLEILRKTGLEIIKLGSSDKGLAAACASLNEPFNHWIIHHTPLVAVKAAMTLDGKIATASGESKWITGAKSRAYGMKLRQGCDAILVGINTILADDPTLTVRLEKTHSAQSPKLRRIVLDSQARTPLSAKVVSDKLAHLTTIIVSRRAPRSRTAALARRVNVLVAPTVKPGRGSSHRSSTIDLRWLLKRLGAENVTSLLVEGGGEVNASFLLDSLAQRVAFFYAPKILGGADSRKAVSGTGLGRPKDVINLRDVKWQRLGPDWLLTAKL